MQADPARWRWAAASCIGTSHLRSGTRKQDAYVVRPLGADALVAMVSDGAGSAVFGGQGAWLLCRGLVAAMREWCARSSALPDDDTVHGWIDGHRDRIGLLARSREVQPRAFASTLVAVLVTSEGSLVLHVGDGAVVGRADGAWDVLSWPENGEFASTTYFVTDDAEVRLRTARPMDGHDAYAIFSDGIEDIAVEQANRSAHAPFFDPMMKPVDRAAGVGHLDQLSIALARYLDGSAICDRTDDDKTLILLSRS